MAIICIFGFVRFYVGKGGDTCVLGAHDRGIELVGSLGHSVPQIYIIIMVSWIIYFRNLRAKY